MTDTAGVDATRLDRVRKLLAKAERAGTADEAEIYNQKAVELMARHGIDDALLAASGPARTDPIGSVRITVEDPYSAGKARLLGWTATACRCRWVMHDARAGTVGAVTVFGYATDRERVELLYTSLLLQASRQLTELRPPDRTESVAAYRRSWLYGFAARIHERLRAAEERAATERDTEDRARGGSTALVLADRTDQVDRAYAAEFGSLRRARRPTVSGSGWSLGVAAADRADIGATRVGAAGRRSLGRSGVPRGTGS